MPDKAKSKAQFRFLKGIETGSIPSRKGLGRKKAGEMLGDQSPKGLPERKRKVVGYDDSRDLAIFAAPKGKPKKLTGQARRV